MIILARTRLLRLRWPILRLAPDAFLIRNNKYLWLGLQDQQLFLLQKVEGPSLREHPRVHLPPVHLWVSVRDHRVQVERGLGRIGAGGAAAA